MHVSQIVQKQLFHDVNSNKRTSGKDNNYVQFGVM